MEVISARADADEARAEATEARRLQASAREEASAASLRASVAEEAAQDEAAKATAGAAQIKQLEADLKDAESLVGAAVGHAREAAALACVVCCGSGPWCNPPPSLARGTRRIPPVRCRLRTVP